MSGFGHTDGNLQEFYFPIHNEHTVVVLNKTPFNRSFFKRGTSASQLSFSGNSRLLTIAAFRRIFSASLWRPLEISQRGDSGTILKLIISTYTGVCITC